MLSHTIESVDKESRWTVMEATFVWNMETLLTG